VNFDSNLMGSFPAEDFRKIPFPCESFFRVQGEAEFRDSGFVSTPEELEAKMKGFNVDRVAFLKGTK
jgi:hypothetical protein